MLVPCVRARSTATGPLLSTITSLSPLLPPPPLQPTAAPRWVFRANFPKAIYQSVQSYSPQPSSYIFSSPGWGGERRCQEIGEAASRSTGAWPGPAKLLGSDGIMSLMRFPTSYLSIRHYLHQFFSHVFIWISTHSKSVSKNVLPQLAN